jgi:hypothetical protein
LDKRINGFYIRILTLYICIVSKNSTMDKFSYISNAHVAYIDELYADYKNNPDSIDPSWKTFFDGFDFAITKFGESKKQQPQNPPMATHLPKPSPQTVPWLPVGPSWIWKSFLKKSR